MNNDGIGLTPYAGIAHCGHRAYALCYGMSHLRCLVGVFFLSEE